MFTRSQLVNDFIDLGIAPGDTIMIHSSMRSVGPVLGGPDVVVQVLLDVVGESGTLMAYTDWEHAVQHLTRYDRDHPFDDEILEELPPYNPRTSRARRAYGVLPEFLRTWPGAVRSGNPDASMTAIGEHAEWLCTDHPIQYGYGPGSPLAKLVEIDGKILLLGAPRDTVTLLHYSEHVAELPNKRVIRYREPILVNGLKRWMEIEEFDTSDPVVPGVTEDYFGDIVNSYIGAGRGRSGRVGNATSSLLDAADLHLHAVDWLERRFGGS